MHFLTDRPKVIIDSQHWGRRLKQGRNPVIHGAFASPGVVSVVIDVDFPLIAALICSVQSATF